MNATEPKQVTVASTYAEGYQLGLFQALELVKLYVEYGKDPVENLKRYIQENEL